MNGGSVTTSGNYGTNHNWQHLQVQRSGTTVTVYVDGVADATTNSLTSSIDLAGTFYIGGRNDANSARYFGGLLDNMRLQDRALSQAWISAEHLNQSTTTDFYTTEAVEIEIEAGTTTLTNHEASQTNNNFNFMNKENEPLFAFRLEDPTATTTITELVLTLSGVRDINPVDFTNITLYKDTDNDALYDATDEAVGGAGVMSINGDTGTITFGTTFTSTTTQNYLVTADWNYPADTSSLNIDLSGNNITATDESGTHDFIGEVRRAQHSRLSTRSGGGGGNSSRVGTPAPAGDGEVTGGSNEGGELIGSNPNFYLPTANSGSWNNAPNAYDQEDGTYATDDSGTTNNFTNHSFVVNQTNSIQGIEIKLEVSGTTGAGDIDVELSYDGGTSWTTVKTTPTLTTTDTVVTLGGPADTWGRAWTPAEFSNANFQVRLSASPSANTIQVDAIQVRVYHQASAPAPGGGGGGRI